MKQLLLLIILTLTLFARDVRLNDYPQALEWEKTANTNADSAYNLALIYHTKIKDTNKAIKFYQVSYKLKKSSDVANNLGALYESINEYDKAIKWYKDATVLDHTKSMINLALLYKKAYAMGEIKGAYGLGYLYDVDKKDYNNAIIWYKKAAKQGYPKAINNLAYIYKDKKNKLTASAYILATIEYGYGGKKDTLTYLKNKWKIDSLTLQKAYKLQQTLDIPKHYTGGIN